MPPVGLLLAGPILRRVTQESVVIWVALSEPATLTVELFGRGDGAPISTTTSATVVRLTAGCVIAHLHVKRDQGSLGSGVFEYDIFAADRDSAPAAASLLDAEGRLRFCLAGMNRPSFVIPGTNEPWRILMGSCRKVHAEGGPDAIAYVQAHAGAADRLHAIVLCGDQIYADDVHPALLRGFYASGLIDQLTQAQDISPSYVTTQELVSSIGRRKSFILSNSPRDTPLTADDAASSCHLCTLAELVAMYLSVWSPKILSRVAESLELPRAESQILESACAEAEIYSRLFANAPVYMLADDHEATDDWNFDDGWIQCARTQADRRSLFGDYLTYAELAYLYFQHVGNVYGDRELTLLLNELPQDYSTVEDAASGAESALASYRAKGGYSFRVDASPPMIFIDTRVGRSMAKAGYPGLWRLLGDSISGGGDSAEGTGRTVSGKRRLGRIFSSQDASRWLSLVDGIGDCVLIVTPSPVLTLPFVEQSQGLMDPLEYDREGWQSNPQDLLQLLEAIQTTNIRRIVIASGDLHFSYAATAAWRVRRKVGGRLVQVVSSALKNKGSHALAWMEQRLGSRSSWVWYSGHEDGRGTELMANLTEHDGIRTDEDLNEFLERRDVSPLQESLRLTSAFETIRFGAKRMVVNHNALVLSVSSKVYCTWLSKDGRDVREFDL